MINKTSYTETVCGTGGCCRVEFLERTERLIGNEALAELQRTHVLIAGIGGVGSYVAEALVRSGIGFLTLVDDDVIDITNINRQLHALHSTVGALKVDAMRSRLLDINPNLSCKTIAERISGEYEGPENVDYVVDCVDDVKAKAAIIRWALTHQLPVISSMGSGNRIDNRQFEISDIKVTRGCPLARSVRKTLREQGITEGVKVCYNPNPVEIVTSGTPGTISYVPATCGLLIAGEVIRDIISSLVV